MPYVYCTGTSDNWFEEHVPKGTVKDDRKRVLIHGGANLANKLLETPRGVVTKVTDSELEFLKSHHTFKEFIKAGFITYDSKQIDIDKMVAGMESQDLSAPVTEKEGDELAKASTLELGEQANASVKVNKKS